MTFQVKGINTAFVLPLFKLSNALILYIYPNNIIIWE